VIECSVSNNEIGSFGSVDIFKSNDANETKQKIETRNNKLLALSNRKITTQG